MRRVLLMVIGFSMYTSVYAQVHISGDIVSGSIYSSIGSGLLKDNMSPGSYGMGVYGVAIVDPYTTNMVNPATWGDIFYTKAIGQIGFNQYFISDETGLSQNSANLVPEYTQITLPLKRNTIGISVGYTRFNEHNYTLQTEHTFMTGRLTDDGSDEEVTYFNDSRGLGNIGLFSFGLGWRINKYLSVGYASNLFSGVVDKLERFVFDNSIYDPLEISDRLALNGLSHRIGVMVKLYSLFSSKDRMLIGLSMRSAINLNSKHSITYDRLLTDGIETILYEVPPIVDDPCYCLPYDLSFGMTYGFNSKIQLSTDFLYQPWSKYKNDYQVVNGVNYKDRIKIGLGIQFSPFLSNNRAFFSKFRYQFGFSYDMGYFELNQQKIESILFNMSILRLDPKSNSGMNLSFQFGIRGTEQANLVREIFYGIKFGINLSELMFLKPKYR